MLVNVSGELKEGHSSTLMLAIFAGAFALARALLFFVDERRLSIRVALWATLVEAIGLATIWAAAVPWLMAFGTALTGLGYAIALTGFGLEALRRTRMDRLGTGISLYVTFLDLAMLASAGAIHLIAKFFEFDDAFSIALSGCIAAALIGSELLAQAEQ